MTTPKSKLPKLGTPELIAEFHACELDEIANKVWNHTQRRARKSLIVDTLYTRGESGDTVAESWVQAGIAEMKAKTESVAEQAVEPVVQLSARRTRKSVAK